MRAYAFLSVSLPPPSRLLCHHLQVGDCEDHSTDGICHAPAGDSPAICRCARGATAMGHDLDVAYWVEPSFNEKTEKT